VAVQITGGERKRQDAPPVEPDAGKAGRAVEQSRVEMERWCTEQIRQHGRSASTSLTRTRGEEGATKQGRRQRCDVALRRQGGAAPRVRRRRRPRLQQRQRPPWCREGGGASAPVRRLTLDRHDAERKQLRREGEAEQAVEALGREGERQGKQRAADARLVPR